MAKGKFLTTSFSAALVAAIASVTFSSCDGCNKYEEKWKEELSKEEKNKVDEISLNVFIENSGSIDGYVNGMNLFKTDTYAMISNSVVNNTSLNYINKQAFKQNVSARDFILDLTPAKFKSAGGDRSSSDISRVIETATKGSSKTPVLLVSDFIFSPDPAHRTNVEEYFNLEKNDIKNTISKLLKGNSNLAVVVFQGVSNFNGFYWNKNETTNYYNGSRPYYTMLVGPKQQLALLINKTKGTTHFVHGYSEFTPSAVNYEILKDKQYKVGNFRPCKKSKHHIEKIQTERRGTDFAFNIAVDFSNIPLNELYLLDKNNYELSDRSYQITSIKKDADKQSGFTHVITIASTTEKPRSADLDITLKKLFPQWIKDSQDNDGTSAVKGKTFGIQPLLEGVQLAYSDSKVSKDYYVKMKVILDD